MCAKRSHKDQLELIKPGSSPALRGTGWDAKGTWNRPTGCAMLMVDPMPNANAGHQRQAVPQWSKASREEMAQAAPSSRQH